MDLQWTRSSYCGTGACVVVAYSDGEVQVRDSKLRGDSPIQAWTDREWQVLLDHVFLGIAHPEIKSTDDRVQLGGGWGGRDLLTFDRAEWAAFVDGVIAGDFDLDRLSTSAPASEGEQVADEVGPVTSGSDLAATGAGNGPGGVVPVPVVAASSAEEHRKRAEEMLASAHDADADADPVDVALVLQFAQTHALLSIAASLAPWPDDLEPPAGVPLKDDGPLRLGAAPLVPVDENTGACSEVAA